MASWKNLRLPLAGVSLSLGLLLAACGGKSNSADGAGSFYEPVGNIVSSGHYAGLWVVSADQPSNTPIQLTPDTVDIPDDGAGPTFYDWTYASSARKRDKMLPAFFAYGDGGHIYGVSLSQPGTPRQLSSGSYTTLCSEVAVQAGPYSTSKSYVLARVTVNTSTVPCDTSWIIATTDDANTAPTIPPAALSFVGGLKDPSTGLVTGFLMHAGNELDVYAPDTMTKTSTLISSLPTGAKVSLVSINSSLGPTQGVVVETGSLGITSLQDDVYLASSSQAQLVGSYSIPTSAACSVVDQPSFVAGTASDSTLLYEVPNTTGGPGFKLYSVPLSGGTPVVFYTDTTDCAPNIDGLSGDRLVLDVYGAFSNTAASISVSITGSATQTPLTLQTSDTTKNIAFVHYVVGNNAWIDDFTFDPTTGATSDLTASVVDVTSGKILKTYAHSRITGDLWKGFNADGSIDRGPMFIATGIAAAGCDLTISSFESVDTESFASNMVTVSDAPCAHPIFGPAPLAVGWLGSGMYYLSEPSNGSLTFGKIGLPASGNFAEVFGTPVY
ncbi:MAG: hypothetical protein ACM3ZT_08080 [Bacillota bacterium]